MSRLAVAIVRRSRRDVPSEPVHFRRNAPDRAATCPRGHAPAVILPRGRCSSARPEIEIRLFKWEPWHRDTFEKNGNGTPRQEAAQSPLSCGPGLKRGRASSSPSVSRENSTRARRARQTFVPISRSGPVTMPPMPRRVLAVLSLFSLLLCLATVVLWVRSYWVSYGLLEVQYLPLDPSLSTYDGLPPRATQRVRDINAARGGLLVFQSYRAVGADIAGVISGRHWLHRPSSTAPSVPNRFHFTFERKQDQFGRYIRLQLPFWGLVLMCAILPASWLLSARRRWRREWRERSGQCVRCGYDLRATPGRCPECGAPATLHRSEQRT